jgi:hypothetical protein
MRDIDPRVVGVPSKYAGVYVLDHVPTRTLAPHNLASWKIIEAILTARGRADFYDLAVAVRGHESGDRNAPGSQRFVSYCIKSGWLRRL